MGEQRADRPRGRGDLRRAARFLRRFRHYRRRAVLAGLVGATASALQLVIPLSSIVLINRVLPHGDFALLARLAAVLAVAMLAALGLGALEATATVALRERMSLDLQRDLFDHLQRLPFAFFKTHDTGYVMSRIVNDAETSVDFPAGLISLGRTSVWFGAAFVLVPTMHWQIGLLTAVVIPLYMALLVTFNRRIKTRFAVVQENTAHASRELFESLSGVYETKAHGAEGRRARAYVRSLAAKARSLVRGRTLMVLANHSTQIVLLAVTLVILVYGGAEVMRQRLTLGELVALSALAGYLLTPVSSLVQQAFSMQRSLAAVERLDEVLELATEPRGEGERPAERARGAISVRGVGFRYRAGEPVLQQVSFDLKPGETALFVGPSGEGKSSLMSLLPRFFTPFEGEIRLDGVPLETLDLRWLRRQIAFVSQDTFLFSTSVLENLRMGRPEASLEEIREAARKANALEFIEELPEGFATRVGERGCRLSGGQRQRIAIARALLRGAPILILDEATSAVDQQTEKAVYEALGRLMKGRTTLVVAHHAEAFLHRVDRMFEVRDGQVEEVRPTAHTSGLQLVSG